MPTTSISTFLGTFVCSRNCAIYTATAGILGTADDFSSVVGICAGSNSDGAEIHLAMGEQECMWEERQHFLRQTGFSALRSC